MRSADLPAPAGCARAMAADRPHRVVADVARPAPVRGAACRLHHDPAAHEARTDRVAVGDGVAHPSRRSRPPRAADRRARAAAPRSRWRARSAARADRACEVRRLRWVVRQIRYPAPPAIRRRLPSTVARRRVDRPSAVRGPRPLMVRPRPRPAAWLRWRPGWAGDRIPHPPTRSELPGGSVGPHPRLRRPGCRRRARPDRCIPVSARRPAFPSGRWAASSGRRAGRSPAASGLRRWRLMVRRWSEPPMRWSAAPGRWSAARGAVQKSPRSVPDRRPARARWVARHGAPARSCHRQSALRERRPSATPGSGRSAVRRAGHCSGVGSAARAEYRATGSAAPRTARRRGADCRWTATRRAAARTAVGRSRSRWLGRCR